MAITQYTEPATTNPTLTDWQSSIARDNASSRGFAEVDLDDYDDGSTAPKVAVGSRFDNNGALYVVSGADESATGIAAIANSTTFYIYYDVSEGEFLASTTAPTFDKEKRGWYNGNDRALFKVYKDSGGEYDERSQIINISSINMDNIVLTNNIDMSRVITLVYETSTVTEGDLYNYISPRLKSVGDSIMASGLLVSAAGNLVVSYATRTTASRIELYGYNLGLSSVTFFGIDSGGATNYTKASLCFVG